MRNSARNIISSFSALIAILILLSFPVRTVASEEQKEESHEIEDARKDQKKQKGAFSEEDMEAMRLRQHMQDIASSNYQVSEFATFYFEQRGEKVVSPLLALLKRKENNDRYVSAIIYTFGRMGPNAARAVPVITKYLNYENIDIKKTAIASLGNIGKASDPAVPEIAKFLENDDEWIQTLALRSLKDIGTRQSKAIASLYEKKKKLAQERKNRELLHGGPEDSSQPQPTN